MSRWVCPGGCTWTPSHLRRAACPDCTGWTTTRNAAERLRSLAWARRRRQKQAA